MGKTIRIDRKQQQQGETHRYRQSLLVGERLSAVSELSAAAYGIRTDQIGRLDKTITRISRLKGDDNA